MAESNHLMTIPLEIIYEILQQLPLRDVYRVLKTSKPMQEITKSYLRNNKPYYMLYDGPDALRPLKPFQLHRLMQRTLIASIDMSIFPNNLQVVEDKSPDVKYKRMVYPAPHSVMSVRAAPDWHSVPENILNMTVCSKPVKAFKHLNFVYCVGAIRGFSENNSKVTLCITFHHPSLRSHNMEYQNLGEANVLPSFPIRDAIIKIAEHQLYMCKHMDSNYLLNHPIRMKVWSCGGCRMQGCWECET